MPDDLYRRDIVRWAEAQTERLRRVAGGERVNDLDWENVIEEIESVGRSQVQAVESLLFQALLHAMKVARWPDHPAAAHSRGEIRTHLVTARKRFTPGMAQLLDAGAIHADALEVVRDMDVGQASLPLRDATDVTLDELLSPALSTDDLIARMRDA